MPTATRSGSAAREHDDARAIRHRDDARLADPDPRVEPTLAQVAEHDGRARRADQLDQQRAAIEHDRARTDARADELARQRELELAEPDARAAPLGGPRRHQDPAIRRTRPELLARARAVLALAHDRAPLLALDQRGARSTRNADDRDVAAQLADRDRRAQLRAVGGEPAQLAVARDAPDLSAHHGRRHDADRHVLGGHHGAIRKQRDEGRARLDRRVDGRAGEVHQQDTRSLQETPATHVYPSTTPALSAT